METLIANKKWLGENSLRLDASFYMSDGIKTILVFNKSNKEIKPLSEVTESIFYGGRDRRNYVTNPETGIPFIKGADITLADFSKLKTISRRRTKNLSSYFLKEEWILVTRSGTIGNTAYVNKDFIGKAASDDIIRIVPKDIKSGFLYAYLTSKYGNALITHGKYGAVIQHIEPEHIAHIPVPIFPKEKQEQIHNLITEAATLRVEANRLLEEAVEVFDKTFICKNNSKINSISIRSIHSRFDAISVIENSKVETVINKHPIEWVSINSISKKIFIGPRSKRNYVKKGIPFLSGSELQKANPTKVEKFLTQKDANPFIVHKDWLLITRSGTIGNISLILPILDGYGATDDAIRVVLKDNSNLSSKYLFAFLSSNFGKTCIQKDTFGSVIQHINEEQVGNILVPIIDVDKIEQKIEKYCGFINKSIVYENQAISLVENEIALWQA